MKRIVLFEDMITLYAFCFNFETYFSTNLDYILVPKTQYDSFNKRLINKYTINSVNKNSCSKTKDVIYTIPLSSIFNILNVDIIIKYQPSPPSSAIFPDNMIRTIFFY